jgi:NAD(P)-dependent dehydrogenase (short-subunit alcohol dehydrogenase family)
MHDLTGKVALITGGSRGLGRAIVDTLATYGADIVVASRKLDACAETATQVKQMTGRATLAVAYHAGRWADAELLADAVYARFGRCDILVNNAGMSPLYSSLTSVTEELFDKVVGVNFKGPFRLSALIGERMAASDGGSIIHISSSAAVHPTEREVVYAGAKLALHAMSAAIARGYGPTVRSNVVMAGPFNTEIAKSWDMDAFRAEVGEHMAIGRLGEPSEVVGAVLYLASRAAGFTTGSVIKVDGGYAFAAG